MRMPQRRVTIGLLMVAVVVAGTVFWEVRQVINSRLAPIGARQPSIGTRLAERQAEASYKQARLVREVAEYALKEYEQGIRLQARAGTEVAILPGDAARPRPKMPIVRWKGEPPAQLADFDPGQEFTRNQQITSLRSDVEKARADEEFKRAIYEQQRVWTANSPRLVP